MLLGLGLGGICAGIAVESMGVSGGTGAWLLAGGLILLCLRRWSTSVAAGLLLFSSGCGLWAAGIHAATGSSLGDAAEHVPLCSLRARVIEQAGALGTLLAAEELACEGRDHLVDAGLLTVDADGLDAGSLIQATGWLLPLQDDAFDLARRRAGASAAWHSRELQVIRAPAGLHGIAAAFRAALTRGVGELGFGESGLVLGLTIGDTSRLGLSTIESFRAAGLAHILAVSGSNVAIILAAVLFLARRTTARFRVASSLVTLSLYVLVVGPDPSVLRAAVSAVVVIVAFAGGFRAQPLHALGLALLILLILRPQLLYAAGLHLSVAATVGILLWTGPLSDRFARLPRAIRLGAAATLAAQAGVAPVLIATFGELSLAGPAANVLALPAVAPATVLGLASGVMATVNLDIAQLIARAAGPFLRWILWVGESFGRQGWASVSLPRMWAVPATLILCRQ